MIRKLHKFFQELMNPERDFQERLFLVLTTIAECAMALACLGDILTGENWIEIAVLMGVLLVSPFFVSLTIRTKKINMGAGLIACGIICVVLPVTFFFGGGLTGGSIVWFVVSYLYIGLVLVGRPRFFMLLLLTMLVFVLYLLSYFYPELIVEHSRHMWYADSALSVLLVGFMVYIMVWFQNRLFRAENERALKQAEEIRELNRSQTRFFSSMSHEIRTPINTIIGLNEMILREDISDEVAEDARNIQSASKILLSLINDILDMSKMQSGKMDIVPVSYDVGKMLSEIVNMIWIKAHEKGLQFSVDVDPSLPAHLFSDEVRIKQILINLLNNAVKYTKEGSVTLSIHSRKLDNGRVLVTYSVEDTGMGIRKESIPHLFDAFRRMDEEKNRYIEGTGLGLSIVKQLVDLMGGTISVNSVYTKGSTFVVELEQELVDEGLIGKFDLGKFHAGNSQEQYRQKFEASEAKILVVDDNSVNLLVVKKLLRGTKVRVDTAESGRECLKLTLQNHYHVIFMDHMMPEMDGIACMHEIRQQQGGLCRETPVVALTANAGSENQALYRREGFEAYLLKPVEGGLLEETLLSLLPRDLVQILQHETSEYQSDRIVRQSGRKVPLIITTDSVSDLPMALLKSHNIPVLPYKVHIAGGVFADGTEADGDVIIRYMADGSVKAKSEAPEVAEYEAFFADNLSHAQHILHIAMAKRSSRGFANASEAALSFYNVRVVDSGHLSSGMGMMALIARMYADKNATNVDEWIDKLEEQKNKIQTSFIVDSTEYLNRGGRLSDRVHTLCNAFMLHPVIVMKDSSMKVGTIILGSRETARRNYIRKTLKAVGSNIDTSVLFITYAGMKRSEVEEVKELVLSMVKFETVYLQKASPAISINCGPGTFGLIFARR